MTSVTTVQKTTTLTLDNLAKDYVGNLTSRARETAIQELGRFVRWCGRDRPISGITPNDIAAYAQWAAPSGGEAIKRLEPVKAFLAHLKKRAITAENLSPHLRVVRNSSKRQGMATKAQKELVAITKEGFLKIQQEMDSLKKSRVTIAQELNSAREDKDFRENAPLDAAREHQGRVEARIRELEQVLKSAIITDEESVTVPINRGAKRAGVGSRVVIRDLIGGDFLSYLLVNPSEASISSGKLSATSPTGKAIFERGEGEEIAVVAPMGTIRYRIEKIEN